MCDLEVPQPAREVQDVSQVGFGVSIAAGRFGQTQLLSDGVELQRMERKHLASLQQLLTYRNTHKQAEVSHSLCKTSSEQLTFLKGGQVFFIRCLVIFV